MVALGEANERVRGSRGVSRGRRVSLGGSLEERLGGVGVGGEPVGVRAEARRVRVRHAVVAHGKRVELDTLQLGLDAFPLHEDPGRVELTLDEGIPDAEHGRRVLDVVAGAARVLDHALHDAAFEASGVGRVPLTVEVLRGCDAGGFQRHDGGGVAVSEQGCDRLELRATGCGVPADDAFRRVHGEVCAAFGHLGARRDVLGSAGGVGVFIAGVVRSIVLGIRGGDDRHVQARGVVEALVLGDEEPEVVAVRGPVERDGDLRGHRA